ncbi:MAG TPA: ATP-binding cassette domain-containing protein [Jiangellaceae bacterium]
MNMISGGGARVRARGWGWRHAGRRSPAVRGLDLDIEPGERILLLGASGAGKSTLLAALAGLLDPDHSGEATGELTVDGRDPRTTRDRSALVLQDPETQLVMARAGDDVAFGLENRAVPRESIWPRVDAALDAVGFPYGRTHRTDQLSGGEQQRLALAGALALEPGLLLLDEPTANVDPGGAAVVRQAIRAVLGSTGATMVLVEHRVAETLDMIDRVVVLEPGGGVRASGTPSDVFTAHGESLAAEGVWVPDLPLGTPRRSAPGPDQLRAEDVTVDPGLHGVSAVLTAGEVVAVTGPNGAGKSTLAGVLGGLRAPESGTVRGSADLAGPDADVPPHRWRAPALAARIGMVFQDPEHQFLTARVRDELAFGPRRRGAPDGDVARLVDDLLDRLHLTGLANANPFTLSGGEKRRLSVATALTTSPPVLILDEPTFGQDRRTWLELVDLLAAHRSDGGSILIATHDTALVEVLADRVLPLDAGRVAASEVAR